LGETLCEWIVGRIKGREFAISNQHYEASRNTGAHYQILFQTYLKLSCALKAKMVDLQVSVAATLLDLLHL
jgi:hypothetical protein